MARGDGAFSEHVKQLIRSRARGKCEACGLPLMAGAQYHHRKPRRMGGTSDKRVASAANGVMLHPACHERIEKDRSRAYENGWLLYPAEWPEEVPVKFWSGWVLLTGSTATPTSPPPPGGRHASDRPNSVSGGP